MLLTRQGLTEWYDSWHWGGTPTFWSRPENCDFRRNGNALRGPAGPLGAVSYCAFKLYIYSWPLQNFPRTVCIYNPICGALAVVLIRMTFRPCCRSLDSADFSSLSATLVIRPVAFLCSSLLAVFVTRLFTSRLFGGVHLTTNVFRSHSIGRVFALFNLLGCFELGAASVSSSSPLSFSAYPFPSFDMFLKIASYQSIRFSWFQSANVDVMESP